MKFRWLNKNVNLDFLIEHAKSFFEINEFKTRTDKLEDGWIVFAVKSLEGYVKTVTVKVWGQPDDFTIEFSFGGHGHELVMIGPFITLFGLGAIVRREARWMEFFETVERNFWVYMEDAVADFNKREE